MKMSFHRQARIQVLELEGEKLGKGTGDRLCHMIVHVKGKQLCAKKPFSVII